MANLSTKTDPRTSNRRTQSNRRSVEFWLDLDPTGGLAYQAQSQGWSGPSDGDEDED